MDRDAFSRMLFERVGQIFPGGLPVAVQEQVAEGDRVASDGPGFVGASLLGD